jgi:hypothetical protein
MASTTKKSSNECLTSHESMTTNPIEAKDGEKDCSVTAMTD